MKLYFIIEIDEHGFFVQVYEEGFKEEHMALLKASELALEVNSSHEVAHSFLVRWCAV